MRDLYILTVRTWGDEVNAERAFCWADAVDRFIHAANCGGLNETLVAIVGVERVNNFLPIFDELYYEAVCTDIERLRDNELFFIVREYNGEIDETAHDSVECVFRQLGEEWRRHGDRYITGFTSYRVVRRFLDDKTHESLPDTERVVIDLTQR